MEPVQDLLAAHAAPDQLDGDLLLKLPVSPNGSVYGTHPAGADQAHQSVGADLSTDGYCLACVQGQLDSGSPNGWFQEIRGSVLGGKQRLNR